MTNDPDDNIRENVELLLQDNLSWKERFERVYKYKSIESLADLLYENMTGDNISLVIPFLMAWNESQEDRKSEKDVYTIASKSLKKCQKEKTQNKILENFAPISLAEFKEMNFPPIKWRINGLIPEQAVISLSSPAGVAKTWTALDISLSIASGKNFLEQEDFRSTKGKVLYLDAEMGLRSIHKRCMQLGYGELEELESFYILNSYEFNMRTEGSVEYLKKFIEEKNIDVLIIDTFRPFSGGADENSGTEVREFFQNFYSLRDKGLSIIILDHHRKKAPMEGKRPTKEKLIGSQDKMASVDVALMLHEDSRNKIIEIHQVKNRFSEELPPFGFKMIDEKDDNGKIIRTRLEFAEIQTDEINKLEKAKELILDILVEQGPKSRSDLISLLKEAGIGETICDKARKKLIEEEIVNEVQNGRKKEYFVSDDRQDLLKEL